MLRKLALLAAGIALGATLVYPAAAQTRGGTLSFARAQDSIFLDPVYTRGGQDIWIVQNLYDSLILAGKDGKSLEPGLASEYSLSADGRTVTLKLREGIKFADGSPIELSDVKWSLDRARVKETGGNFYYLLSSISEVEVREPNTVTLRLGRPDPVILSALSGFNAGILPEKLLTAQPGADLKAKAEAFAQKPIGSGPFVVTSWDKNSKLVLSRNPHYWKQGADGKALPYLDQVSLEVVPDDATRILKLKAGEIGGIENVPLARVADLKTDDKIEVDLFPSTKTQYINLNVRETLANGSKNPLADVRVRKALNHAVDKKAFIKVLTHGLGKEQQSLIPSQTPYFYSDGVPYPYDLDKAKALLAEAGYPDGFEFSIFTVAGNTDRTAQAEILQQLWSRIGVKLKIEPLENTTFQSRFRSADYNSLSSNWSNDLDDPSQVTSFLAYYPTVQSNFSGYRNENLEKIFVASQEQVKTEERAQSYKDIQKIYVSDAPVIFLVEVPFTAATLKSVKDFRITPLGNQVFRDAYLANP